MGVIIEVNAFDPSVYQYDETDLVLGGPDGTANAPLKNLANRTRYLFNNLGVIENFDDEVILAGSAPIGAALKRKLIVAFANGANITLTLDNPNVFKPGTIIPIAGFTTPGNAITISAPNTILNPVDGAVNEMHIHHNEHLVLIAFADHYKVGPGTRGNFFNVGEEFKARKIIGNALAFTGQLVSRAAYPRLWKFVQSLTLNQEKVSEFVWNNNGFVYKGLFTDGDGVTNFRLPDERGMFERMLDMGRGVDMDRLHNYPGGFEEDELKAHAHNTTLPYVQHNLSGTTFGITDGPGNAANNKTYQSGQTGGNETRPKNIGKINQIKF